MILILRFFTRISLERLKVSIEKQIYNRKRLNYNNNNNNISKVRLKSYKLPYRLRLSLIALLEPVHRRLGSCSRALSIEPMDVSKVAILYPTSSVIQPDTHPCILRSYQ